jgi:hypothetical protein
MAKSKTPDSNIRRVVFARIGWMHFYNGPVPGDERPIGGGKYNKNKIGHEVYNFRVTNGRLYGYFQPSMLSDKVSLERIDAKANRDTHQLDNVLIIFVARVPGGGQVIVGWYKDATLVRERIKQSPGTPKGYGYFCSALVHDCTLLPQEYRRFEIPSGKGGIGEANICYTLTVEKLPKDTSWIDEAVDFVNSYEGSNLLSTPEADAEEESAALAEKALARSKGQGFPQTAKERKAIEEHAMKIAIQHFKKEQFKVEDVSKWQSYDLLCSKNGVEIHVEVKGTTTDGETVVLTRNEVEHAAIQKTYKIALFILHSIRLEKTKASGGTKVILNPWHIKEDRLTAISYTYRLA